MNPILNGARFESQHVSEQELMIMAEQVLGQVPDWFVENKKVIENNRVEAEEAASRLIDELQSLFRRE